MAVQRENRTQSMDALKKELVLGTGSTASETAVRSPGGNELSSQTASVQKQSVNPPQSQQNFANTASQDQAPKEYPMKWFKFLIYFSLWISAISNLVYAVRYLTGSVYTSWQELYEAFGNDAASIVYAYYTGLKTLDSIYGMALIALAVFGAFTRFQLSAYKKTGPACLLALYALDLVIPTAYGIAASSIITGASAWSSSTVSSVIVSLVMITANQIYFNKRKSLFIN